MDDSIAGTRTDDEANECIFQWKIENISNFWWMEDEKRFDSPTFIANALLGTKWSLHLYLKNKHDFISVYLQRAGDCSGPNIIEVKARLAFLGKGNFLLSERIMSNHNFGKGESRGYVKFVRRERVFYTERDAFIPKDTLTVLCTIKKINKTLDPSKYVYGRTVMNMNRKSFVWKLEDMSSLQTDSRYEFKDSLFDFHLILVTDSFSLLLNIISCRDGIKYMSFNVGVIDFEGKRDEIGIKSYFPSDLKTGESHILEIPNRLQNDKSRYLPNDVMTLDVELEFSTIEYFPSGSNSSSSEKDFQKMEDCHVREGKSLNKVVLIEDFKSLCNEGIFSDTEIRTSTRILPAHKGILSARSTVFRRMFSNAMKEAISGHVDIADFEEDTVHRLLLYIYTGTLEDLQYESAFELYKISDKYQILSLKNICSSFLKDKLCPNKVCDVLVLADLYQDVDLKDAVEAYILDHDEVFNSMEWKTFIDSNVKRAADIMYKRVNTVKIYKGKM